MTGEQIDELIRAIADHWDIQRLGLLAYDLGENLDNLAPGAAIEVAALKLINKLSEVPPPRHEQMLTLLAQADSPPLAALAKRMLVPDYLPPGDPLNAIVVGQMAFVNRADLRAALMPFTAPTSLSTRVLVVRGEKPCGKSYTWQFLRHLAIAAHARPHLVKVSAMETPRELFDAVFSLLRLDSEQLPRMTDRPQLARLDPLLFPFKGEIAAMQDLRHWLVIDELSDPATSPAVRDAAFAIAAAVEEAKADRVWVALLGYNNPLAAGDMRQVAQDFAEFPDPDCVAKHLHAMSCLSPLPLTEQRAEEIAGLLFSAYPEIDKAAMTDLTPLLEAMGEKLYHGIHP